MLERCTDALCLNGIDVRRGKFTREDGVLRVILKVSAAERRTLDIYARSQKDGHTVNLAVIGKSAAYLREQAAVP